MASAVATIHFEPFIGFSSLLALTAPGADALV
jgi:hypothetical protein